jgi:hypothetical protein
MNQSLQIAQYNVNRSREIVMADFLRRKEVLEADIIAFQELWRNPLGTTHITPRRRRITFYIPPFGEGHYGGYHKGGRPRTGLLIH